MIKNICVYGASSNAIDNVYIDSAVSLGERLAEKGIGLIFGGGASGVMGATARGVHNKNGKIVGIAPRFFNADGVLFENCTELVYTNDMRSRKQLLEEMSDAFIIAAGGVGTFDEFFEILTLKQLGRHNKPMAIYNVNGYYDSLLDMLNKTVKERFMNSATIELFKVFTDIDEMLSYILTYDEDIKPITHYKSVNNNLV
ncbi:MAG: TIGR00730 family Rossman fold protein [Clostridia bacterium]|nr:TIGR00730 family Rossman fold protein [Clostridia bacterium]